MQDDLSILRAYTFAIFEIPIMLPSCVRLLHSLVSWCLVSCKGKLCLTRTYDPWHDPAPSLPCCPCCPAILQHTHPSCSDPLSTDLTGCFAQYASQSLGRENMAKSGGAVANRRRGRGRGLVNRSRHLAKWFSYFACGGEELALGLCANSHSNAKWAHNAAMKFDLKAGGAIRRVG